MIRHPLTLIVATFGLWACTDSSKSEPPVEVLQPVEQAFSAPVVEELGSGSNGGHSWKLSRHRDGCMVFVVDERFAPSCMMLGGNFGQWTSGLSRDLWFISGLVVEDDNATPENPPKAAGKPTTLRVVFADRSTSDTPVEADNVAPGSTAFGYVGPKEEELVGFFLLDADGLVNTSSPVYAARAEPA